MGCDEIAWAVRSYGIGRGDALFHSVRYLQGMTSGRIDFGEYSYQEPCHHGSRRTKAMISDVLARKRSRVVSDMTVNAVA